MTRRSSRRDCPARSSTAHLAVHRCEFRRELRLTRVIIEVGPHKLSATIEVVDQYERLLGQGRFSTDQAGYAAMRAYALAWPDRAWGVQGANGAGRPLAQRLLEAGEHVVDIPAKLAARVRLFDTGHNRKTEAHDATPSRPSRRTKTLRVLAVDGELEGCGCWSTAVTR